MFHGERVNRIPGVIFPQGENTAGPQATINIINDEGSFTYRYVMKDAVAKNQVDVSLGQIPGGRCELHPLVPKRFPCHGQRLFRCVQSYYLLRLEDLRQQPERHPCPTTKIQDPFRRDVLRSEEMR
jgi:hypothetical protein